MAVPSRALVSWLAVSMAVCLGMLLPAVSAEFGHYMDHTLDEIEEAMRDMDELKRIKGQLAASLKNIHRDFKHPWAGKAYKDIPKQPRVVLSDLEPMPWEGPNPVETYLMDDPDVGHIHRARHHPEYEIRKHHARHHGNVVPKGGSHIHPDHRSEMEPLSSERHRTRNAGETGGLAAKHAHSAWHAKAHAEVRAMAERDGGKYCDFAYAELTEFPAPDEVAGCEAIDLCHNNITSIPPGAFDTAPDVKFIGLHHNQLTKLGSGTFKNLKKLDWLQLDGNLLADVAEDVFEGCDSLSHIWLHNNLLTILPPAIFKPIAPHLTHLCLENNLFSYVPSDALRGLTVLENLDLNENDIKRITPGTFQELESLFELDLSDNPLSQIMPGAFVGLGNLAHLTIADTDLRQLPNDAFRGLVTTEFIDLSSNVLSIVEPHAFRGLDSLEELMLCNNKLATLPDKILYNMKPRLMKVHLEDNPWEPDCKRKRRFQGQKYCVHRVARPKKQRDARPSGIRVGEARAGGAGGAAGAAAPRVPVHTPLPPADDEFEDSAEL